ncbi:MAG: hypothetical protein IJC68_03145 [Firmicutes bacterium]|nr:hypothetical protein [Bacillota bacterium]
MKIAEVVTLLDAEVLAGKDLLETEVESGCGSDMMSDVLAFVKDRAVMMTGLVNPQAIRTAEMMDIKCVVFIRGKNPSDMILSLAEEKGIAVLKTAHGMYSACGILYAAGLRSDGSAL